MASVVEYGRVFGARRLATIEGAPHLVTSFGTGAMKPFFAMLDELIAAGVRSERPFTVNPRPVDYANVRYGLADRVALRLLYGKQKHYEAQLAGLGLRDRAAFTCTCYLPEVGNTPARDAVLAWSESSAVVFANAVLGARTNRNAVGIDLLCNVLGKAPEFGLLTDEGRCATWVVNVRTYRLPEAQLLGSAVGQRVVDGVPYITGLDRWLGPASDDATVAYLKDMGAAAASNGAVGLFHVEGVTPEALDVGPPLVADSPGRYVVDDEELARVLGAYRSCGRAPTPRPGSASSAVRTSRRVSSRRGPSASSRRCERRGARSSRSRPTSARRPRCTRLFAGRARATRRPCARACGSRRSARSCS